MLKLAFRHTFDMPSFMALMAFFLTITVGFDVGTVTAWAMCTGGGFGTGT
jgi:hypothetical protein